MVVKIKNKAYNFLKWSEKWTKTDMIYLTKGGFWITASQIISAFSFFCLSIAFANFLPKEIYGTYKFVLSILALLAIPTLGSMGTAVMQAVARGYEGSLIPALKTKIKWGVLGGIGSLIFALYYYINNDPTLTCSFLLISVFVPIFSSFKIYGALLQGRKLFKISSKISIINNIVSISILIITVLLTNNIFIILLSYFLPKNIINAIFLKITLKKCKPNKKEDPETIPYGKYLSATGIILKIASELDKILLWHFLGAAQLAIYAFAIAPVKQISSFISGNILSLAAPKLSKNPMQEIKSTLPKKVFKFFLLVIPIVVLYVLLVPFLYKIAFPQYLESIKYSQFFALTLLFIPTSLLGSTMIAKMKKREITLIRFLSPSFRIIMLLIFTPLYGIFGVILSQLLAGVFHVSLVSLLFIKIKV